MQFGQDFSGWLLWLFLTPGGKRQAFFIIVMSAAILMILRWIRDQWLPEAQV